MEFNTKTGDNSLNSNDNTKTLSTCLLPSFLHFKLYDCENSNSKQFLPGIQVFLYLFTFFFYLFLYIK